MSLGEGITIPKRAFERLSKTKMSVFTQELAVVMFGHDVLATSSLTGKKTTKTALDSIKVNALIGMFAEVSKVFTFITQVEV